jgi:hypothetical protein
VVVIADHNSMSNPTLYWGDHHRFVMNAMRWLAGERFNRDALFAVAGLLLLGVVGFSVRRRRDRVILNRWVIGATGALSVAAVAGMTLRHPAYADLFLHTGNGTDMTYMTKSARGYFTLYGQLTREPHLRPWASNTLKAGHDALFLSAPTSPYSAEQLDIIDDYLKRGKTVVYMASIRSLESPAGRQLQERFDFRMRVGDAIRINGRRPFLVNGPRDLTQGVFRMYVYGGSRGVTVDSGLQKQVWLTWGNFHIKDRDWRNTRHHFDLLSSKEIGGGRFAVLAPVELFTDYTLKNLYQDADVVRQQMAEFIIRVAKWTIDDDTILEEE